MSTMIHLQVSDVEQNSPAFHMSSFDLNEMKICCMKAQRYAFQEY